MKYLVILTDGAGDEKIPELGDKTPLQVAAMDTVNELARNGEIGLVSTIPEGMSPSSDVANLSVMGYDPAVYHTGRSPLEAANMGIEMNDTDVSFRCNLITLRGEGDYEDKTITDHSSGDISTEEAELLIEAINERFANETIRFYPGVSYRHVMIVKNGSTDFELTPPHDVLEQKVGPNMPKGEGVEFISRMMRESYDILSQHPVNKAREAKGLNPANTIWIWGEGKRPSLTPFSQKYKLKGAAISAVDLIKGIAVCAGMEAIDVDGATGTKHTNYAGKAKATIEAFRRGIDYVYVHIEAPDECSHQGDMEGKIECLKDIDLKVVKPLVEYLRSTSEDFRIMILPDHPTPLAIRTHSKGKVPFVIYDSRKNIENPNNSYDEESAAKSGIYFDMGYKLTEYFFKEVANL